MLSQLGLGLPNAEAAPAPPVDEELADVEPVDEVASPPPQPSAGDVATPAVQEPLPQPRPERQVCEPACPDHAVCHGGQCYVKCEPGDPDCGAPPPQSPPEPAPNLRPEPEPKPQTRDKPQVDEPRGFGLRIAPALGMCVGEGCNDFRVGNSAGGVDLGGGMELSLAYRATPHLSLEAGALATFHHNDVGSDPLAAWLGTLVGPRLHLSGGAWRAEPVVGLRIGYVRSVLRWSNASFVADGLAMSADVGVQWRLNRRVSLAMLTGAIVPYWTRVCDTDEGLEACYARGRLTTGDRRRLLWTTSVGIHIHF